MTPHLASPIAEALRDALSEAGLRATPRQLSIAADALVDHLAEQRIDIVHAEQHDPRHR